MALNFYTLSEEELKEYCNKYQNAIFFSKPLPPLPPSVSIPSTEKELEEMYPFKEINSSALEIDVTLIKRAIKEFIERKFKIKKV